MAARRGSSGGRRSAPPTIDQITAFTADLVSKARPNAAGHKLIGPGERDALVRQFGDDVAVVVLDILHDDGCEGVSVVRSLRPDDNEYNSAEAEVEDLGIDIGRLESSIVYAVLSADGGATPDADDTSDDKSKDSTAKPATPKWLGWVVVIGSMLITSMLAGPIVRLTLIEIISRILGIREFFDDPVGPLAMSITAARWFIVLFVPYKLWGRRDKIAAWLYGKWSKHTKQRTKLKAQLSTEWKKFWSKLERNS